MVMEQQEHKPYKKPPRYVQIFLWAYSFLWLNMIFITGLSSIYLGRIDYDTGSIALALIIGIYFIFKYLPRLLP